MAAKNERTPSYTLYAWHLDVALVKSLIVLILSCVIVTFGQPAYSSICATLASTVGFALFFSQVATLPSRLRFFLGFGFFFCVQAVQLFWFTYHPIKAVIAAYLLLSFLMGLQFALLSLLASKKTIMSRFGFLAIPAAWTLLEWSRIYWCSGFYFDLVGLTLGANSLTLQTASLFGVLGMSFWVILTNVAVCRAYFVPKKSTISIAIVLICLPYLYGIIHLKTHEAKQAVYDQTHPPIQTLIVHSKKVPEEFKPHPRDPISPQQRALRSWQELIQAIGPFSSQKLDLMLMPEGVVPFGITSLLFTQDDAQSLFRTYLKKSFPYTADPLLCSEDFAQSLASLFHCPLIIGLEGIERTDSPERSRFFNSAFFFSSDADQSPSRYDKQVLVPMGEYIPGNWAKNIAAKYDIYDSFTPGTGAKLFDAGSHKIGASICYEETVGSMMRPYSALGATLLVNLTDDYWFPYSKLAIQHFEHARPRTVENGVPLIRSCNFGISGAIDSLGRTIVAQEGTTEPSAFLVAVSSYHYPTLYGKFGDWPVLMLSVLICLMALYSFKKK